MAEKIYFKICDNHFDWIMIIIRMISVKYKQGFFIIDTKGLFSPFLNWCEKKESKISYKRKKRTALWCQSIIYSLSVHIEELPSKIFWRWVIIQPLELRCVPISSHNENKFSHVVNLWHPRRRDWYLIILSVFLISTSTSFLFKFSGFYIIWFSQILVTNSLITFYCRLIIPNHLICH